MPSPWAKAGHPAWLGRVNNLIRQRCPGIRGAETKSKIINNNLILTISILLSVLPDMKSPTLLILAAGMGSRFGGLKQMEPVGPSGETLLDYSVYDAIRCGFGKVVFVIQPSFKEVFQEKLGKRFEPHCEVAYAFQQLDSLPSACSNAVVGCRKKPWGTAHAVWCAGEQIDGPFAVINADDFYGLDSFRKLAGFWQEGSTREEGEPVNCCMVGFELTKTLSEYGSVSRGLCSMDSEGNLRDIEELTSIECGTDGKNRAFQMEEGRVARVFSGDEIVSMNCWGLDQAIFGPLEKELCTFIQEHGQEEKSEFYLPFFINRMISLKKMKVSVLPTDSEWFGVTYRQDHPKVVSALRGLVEKGLYPASLWGSEAPRHE